MDVTYRPGQQADAAAVFAVFRDSLEARLVETGYDTEEGLAETPREELWEHKYAPLFTHLDATSSRTWVAERDGQVVGYARSTSRDGIEELTDFFVSPGLQSAGVGRELLARTLPDARDGVVRVILATSDPRALALYLRRGLHVRFPVLSFGREPEAVATDPALEVLRLSTLEDPLGALAAIDRDVLGHARDADHAWLIETRAGFLYRRDGRDVAYGYVGPLAGPVAARSAHEIPALLSHLEYHAARRGQTELWWDVPTINEAAVEHLLARGYRLDAFIVQLMSDRPFGAFDRYVITSPTFFI